MTVSAKAAAQGRCVATLDACGDGSTSSSRRAEDGTAEGSESAAPESGSGGHIRQDVLEDAARPARSTGRKVWDFVKGFGLQLWSIVPYTLHVVRHPIETLEGLWFVLSHPVQTFRAVKQALREAHRDNPQDFWGRVTAEVVTLPFVVSKISKVKAVASIHQALAHSRHATMIHRAHKIEKIMETTARVRHGAHAGELGEEGAEPNSRSHQSSERRDVR